jgi:hypothetical protein
MIIMEEIILMEMVMGMMDEEQMTMKLIQEMMVVEMVEEWRQLWGVLIIVETS